MPLKIAAMLCLLAPLLLTTSCHPSGVSADNRTESSQVRSRDLNSGWICQNIKSVPVNGEQLSLPSYPVTGWLPATVPGTVLTTLLNNKLVPDPFVAMNGGRIPDIFDTGRDTYTYWFVKDFQQGQSKEGIRVWLRFRGVNYGFEAFLNGRKLNQTTQYGMFLRRNYDITSLLSKDGLNRLALLVHPPNPVGDPNGGQGGDGTIGRNVSSQYTAGWDWIQPVADRNTGIWDKVTIQETGAVSLGNPNVVTLVPGKRSPGRPQDPATVRTSAELTNPTPGAVRGTLQFSLDGRTVEKAVEIGPNSMLEVRLPDLIVERPELWWPHGSGSQKLYPGVFRFIGRDGSVTDHCSLAVGIREIQTRWNPRTQSREVLVNGQRIFIKGGNWITSDAMLRLSPERYDAEVRFHRDMNLNLIRIWGGGITERPEFYDACDKYGLMVFQDFWMSGDCNGKWLDPKKKEDQWTRRNYPDDHNLFLASVSDQVKMLRHHPSLAFYCGGNEIPPPEQLLLAIQDSLLPALDNTRYFFSYSNVDSMSLNFIGGNGDGPYSIQTVKSFWERRLFPFNSEIGSVGMGDLESLERFIPAENMVMPTDFRNMDSVWRYHKFSGYGRQIDAYGKPVTVREFAEKAQLVNFDQYRGLMEGHFAHMWDWYTGLIIWKTQNPWTAMRGQMYDYYLDPNACLYGLRQACQPLHVMFNPLDSMLSVVNNTFEPCHDLMVQGRLFDMAGRDTLIFQWFVEVSPGTVQKIESLRRPMSLLFPHEGGFLSLRLMSSSKELLSENLYWLPDTAGTHTGLQQMPEAFISVRARVTSAGMVEVRIENPADGPLAFFQRVSLVDRTTKKRILPVFYSDNYVSVLPGEGRTVVIDAGQEVNISDAAVSLRGWNVRERYVDIQAAAGGNTR